MIRLFICVTVVPSDLSLDQNCTEEVAVAPSHVLQSTVIVRSQKGTSTLKQEILDGDKNGPNVSDEPDPVLILKAKGGTHIDFGCS